MNLCWILVSNASWAKKKFNQPLLRANTPSAPWKVGDAQMESLSPVNQTISNILLVDQWKIASWAVINKPFFSILLALQLSNFFFFQLSNRMGELEPEQNTPHYVGKMHCSFGCVNHIIPHMHVKGLLLIDDALMPFLEKKYPDPISSVFVIFQCFCNVMPCFLHFCLHCNVLGGTSRT